MLCCGLLTLAAAGAVAVWRWLRAAPRTLLVAIAVLLLGAPSFALSTLGAEAHLDRDDILARAMQSLCGGK